MKLSDGGFIWRRSSPIECERHMPIGSASAGASPARAERETSIPRWRSARVNALAANFAGLGCQ